MVKLIIAKLLKMLIDEHVGEYLESMLWMLLVLAIIFPYLYS